MSLSNEVHDVCLLRDLMTDRDALLSACTALMAELRPSTGRELARSLTAPDLDLQASDASCFL